MPRYAGPPRGLKHSVHALLTDEEFDRLKACMGRLNLRQSEVIRQAIDHFHLTKCLSDPPAQTIHPTGQSSV